MKKNLLLSLFFCGITFFSEAQLTVSGTGGASGYPTNDGTYLLLNPPNSSTVDAGTNVYYQLFSGGGCHGGYYIFRKQNFWYFSEDYSCTSYIPPYTVTNVSRNILKYQFFSTSINPPCLGPWERLQAPGTFIHITMSGVTCFQYPSTPNSGLYPNYFQFPALTPTQIATIPNPQPGMAVWDTVNQCLKIYTGAIWRCIP
jgi:hypothetical protein